MSKTTPPPDAADVLVNLILTLLTPMFLVAVGGNIELRVRLPPIPSTPTALGLLSLAMTDGLSIPLTLRLRGSAQSSSRAAEQIRRTLPESPAATPGPTPDASQADPDQPNEAQRAAEIAATRQRAAAAEHPAQPPQSKPQQTPVPAVATLASQAHDQAMWASAFLDVAAEIAAEIPNLPADQRKQATLRAAVLNTSASDLLSGNTDPRLRPGDRPFA